MVFSTSVEDFDSIYLKINNSIKGNKISLNNSDWLIKAFSDLIHRPNIAKHILKVGFINLLREPHDLSFPQGSEKPIGSATCSLKRDSLVTANNISTHTNNFNMNQFKNVMLYNIYQKVLK